jgi:hypothetical protein
MRSPGSPSGLSLTEVMVAAGILSIVSAASVNMYSYLQQAGDNAQLTAAFTRARNSIDADLRNTRLLAASLTAKGNGVFASCFARIPKASCTATDSDRHYPLVLTSLAGQPLSGGTDDISGAATVGQRRTLTASGQSCPPLDSADPDPRCEIEVTTAFRAICAGPPGGGPPADSCAVPQTVELFYFVRQLSGGSMHSRGRRAPILSNRVRENGDVLSRVDAIRVNAAEFMRPTTFSCPVGQAFQGFDLSGVPICGAVDNPCERAGLRGWIFVRMNPDGSPNCVKPLQGEACPSGPGGLPLALRGVKLDGSLDCVAPIIAGQGCPDGQTLVRFDNAGSPVCIVSHAGTGCPANTYLVGYTSSGTPRCEQIIAPTGNMFSVAGPQCGHNSGFCQYSNSNKPASYRPSCPANSFFVSMQYRGPRCCQSCGWVGQWWCDQLIAQCAWTGPARWN